MNSWRSRPFSSVTVHRSSWTAGPGFLPLRPRFFPNADHQSLLDAIRHAIQSAIASPALRAPSARSRCPNSGSSRCASNSAFARYASTTSLGEIRFASHR